MKTGIELIADERARQMVVEGYDITKDADSYGGGQLIGAAVCYAQSALNKHLERDFMQVSIKVLKPVFPPPGADFGKRLPQHKEVIKNDAWPWGEEYDKREKHDKMRSLVIAGALIAAEIDRLQHVSKTEKAPSGDGV